VVGSHTKVGGCYSRNGKRVMDARERSLSLKEESHEGIAEY